MATAAEARFVKCPLRFFRLGGLTRLVHIRKITLKSRDDFSPALRRNAGRFESANLFIADDVGLGKTIEVGLIARELPIGKKVRDIVEAWPPSMLLQWQEERDARSGLSFEILDAEAAADAAGFPSASVRIVLDTIILVRANDSAAGRGRELLLPVISGEHRLTLSNEVLHETARVLRYPRLRELHRLTEDGEYNYIGFYEARRKSFRSIPRSPRRSATSTSSSPYKPRCPVRLRFCVLSTETSSMPRHRNILPALACV